MYINCTNNDISADALIKTVIVDSEGEPFFTCDNTDIGFEDLVRLLIGEDDTGEPVVRIYTP